MFVLDMGSMPRPILANLQIPVDLAGHRPPAALGFHLVLLVPVDLDLLAVLGFHLVLVGLLVRGHLMVLLVLGMMSNEFRLVRVGQVPRGFLADRLVPHLRLVLLVLVVLDRHLVQELPVVHLVPVVRLGHLVLVGQVDLLGMIDMPYLVAGMVLRLLLVDHHFRAVLDLRAVLVVQLALVVLVVQVGSLVRMEYIDSGLGELRRLDAFDGRCC